MWGVKSMFVICVDKNQLCVRQKETLTSGSVNVHQARFSFSKEWDGLERTAFFAAGTARAAVPLGDDGVCAVPGEVLKAPYVRLRAGVRGTRGGETVLPTVWADLGLILEGAAGDGGGEGASDHRVLTGRNLERQHPISAIEGLAAELAKIPAPVEAMTNEERGLYYHA